jgi:hypothetical protein
MRGVNPRVFVVDLGIDRISLIADPVLKIIFTVLVKEARFDKS